MQIRPYREHDESDVVALWKLVLPDDAPHNDPATSIRKKLDVDRELFLIAEVAGAVVGTAMGGYDGHRGWIYSVAVRPEHRHRGIGTALIHGVEAALINRRCLKLNLQVRSANAGVIAFYQKLGFSVEQLICMGKRL
jgi:ribosomal protein S18 acetylase RimI-like enzyme